MRSALLVEDSPTIRLELIPTLAELADVVVVGVAETEREAIAWLTTHPHTAELVVLDLFLREGSGLGVLAQWARLPDRTRVVVLTNYATDEMRRRCEALGAEAVFDKSGELDAFFAHCRGQAPTLH